MKQLTLIRHAKSDWSDATRLDFDRPLNARGKKAASIMGQRMAKTELIPDLMISSPAKRAYKTAKLIAHEIGIAKKAIIYQPEIYEATIQTLTKTIAGFPDAEHIALIGHNSSLTDLAEWLSSKAPAWLPTCAVISFRLEITTWTEICAECGTITQYDYPKKISLK